MVSHLYEYSDKAQCEILMSKFRNTIPSTHNKLFFFSILLKLQSTGINYRILYIKKKKDILHLGSIKGFHGIVCFFFLIQYILSVMILTVIRHFSVTLTSGKMLYTAKQNFKWI